MSSDGGATTHPGAIDRLFRQSVRFGRIWLPAPGVLGLAIVGATLLLVAAAYRWPTPADELSYYAGARRLIDGLPLYDPTATNITPFTYRYPPVLAQVLVPFALVMSSTTFTAVWTVLMMGCLWWLGGRDIYIMLALIAFPPVAVELWYRNVHLMLAVLLVLGLRRWAGYFPMGASIKLAPGLGLVYLASANRWRSVAIALGVGLAILVVSVALSPAAWAQFIEITLARGIMDESGMVGIPYAYRLGAGILLAILAGRTRSPWGEAILVVAVTVASPTLWFTALSLLTALYLILRPVGNPQPASVT
jgi:Glycosyltransferase family 87